MKTLTPLLPRLLAGLLLLLPGLAPAQWVTQTITLKTGWNAVFLHVDPSHATLEETVGVDLTNPILEVWLWAPPASSLQFVQSPQQPVEGAQWVSWDRNSSEQQFLQRLLGNAAYLVRSASNYTWTVKGRPLLPVYDWTTSGLNLLGFPTVPATPPSFESFLSKAPDLQLNAEIYHYPGGELGTTNPVRVFALRNTQVKRGQAFWIRSGNLFNRYFAPFEVTAIGAQGLNYRDSVNAMNFRLRNLTTSNLTVTLRLLGSETPPAGQTNISGVPALIVRGALNTTNLTYGYTNLPLNGTFAWTLTPAGQSGSEVEVVLGLDRVAMGGSVGDLFAGVLRLTDSLGFSQVEFPVAAQTASMAGLWVGSAVVSVVGQYLQTFDRDGTNSPTLGAGGQYTVTSLNTNLAAVSRSFPLRLIVHNPEVGQGNAVLLQQVFIGGDQWTNPIVAIKEAALAPAFRKQARRITAAHLPWTPANQPWAFGGGLGRSASLTTTVTLPFDDQASNPFLHTYHPDHDNLDSSFRQGLPQGSESYTVRREITLEVNPPSEAEASFNNNAQNLGGVYIERITMEGMARGGGQHDARTFEVRGTFSLNRISSIPTLTTGQP